MHRYNGLYVVIFFFLYLVFSLVARGQSTPEDEREARIRARADELRQEKLAKKKEKEKEKEREIREKQDPVLRQARKEIDQEDERAEERAEKLSRAKKERIEKEVYKTSNVQIAGCPPHTVWIADRVGGKSRWQVMNEVVITNLSGVEIAEIRAGGGYGVVLRGLCAGGSITLRFVLGWGDGDTVQVPLTAIARMSGGRVATTQFHGVYLSRYSQQYNRVQTHVWNIRF